MTPGRWISKLATLTVALPLTLAGAAETPVYGDADWRPHMLARCEPHAPLRGPDREVADEALELFGLGNGGDGIVVLEAALQRPGREPWLPLLAAQIYIMAGQGEPHCQPSAGPAPATGDWPRDRTRWLDRAQRLLDRVEAAWPDDGLVDFLRADAARAAGDQETAANQDLRGRGKCTHMASMDLVAGMRDLGRKPPRVIAPIVPTYPKEAVRARVQGEVILDLLIDPQGRATEAVVVGRADRRLAEAARAAARDGGYQAAMVGYYPVWSWLRVPVRFTLDN